MSAAAIIFGIYLLVGVCLCIAAVATKGKEQRGRNFDVSDGTEFGALLFLFIALLWPIWALIVSSKSRSHRDGSPGES